MTYLIVGLDRSTLAPWQRHVRERDVATATRVAVYAQLGSVAVTGSAAALRTLLAQPEVAAAVAGN